MSEAPVGCDIELAANAPFEIAPRAFTPAEQAHLRAARDDDDLGRSKQTGPAWPVSHTAQGDGDARRRFFALWTLKESYLS